MTPKIGRKINVPPELNLLSERVIGAAIEVHRHLGPGYLESVCEQALCIELGLRGIAFRHQVEIDANYKSVHIGKGRIDLLIEDRLVIELKAVDALLPVYQAQLISYLKLTYCKLGLLINFNVVLVKDGILRVFHPSLVS
jgi:GxxExxY protein